MAKVESRVHGLLRRQSVAFLIAALLASSLASLLGSQVTKSHPVLSQLLILLGGSGLGTCFGLVFGSLSNASAVQHIRELIEESMQSAFNAPDEDLDPYRKVWHHYLMTRIEGKVVWRYRTLDFSRLHVPRKLVTAFEVAGIDDRKHRYHVEAYIAPPRMLFLQRAAAGTEPPIIHIYPTATEGFRPQHAGLAFLKSWDGDFLCTPVLMSESPLDLGVAVSREGTLPDETFDKLDALWAREAARVGLDPLTRA
jgi:hypothetical protein